MRLTLMLIAFVALTSCWTAVSVKETDSMTPSTGFFEKGYCEQTVTSTLLPGDGEIVVDNHAGRRVYPICQLPDEFLDWNKQSRLEMLATIRDMMKGETKGGIDLAGPHNGIVATHGAKRSDSAFDLNNAVKGMGFLPKADKIKAMNRMLSENQDKPIQEKLSILEGYYSQLDSLFETDRQISLELYSNPDYMTQTFLNQMTDPVSVIVFLDIPSYKLKTIARLLDPANPNLTDYEQDIVTWINGIHSFFHGPFDKKFIAVVYYVSEVYDNSPRGRNPEKGMGRKISPLIP